MVRLTHGGKAARMQRALREMHSETRSKQRVGGEPTMALVALENRLSIYELAALYDIMREATHGKG